MCSMANIPSNALKNVSFELNAKKQGVIVVDLLNHGSVVDVEGMNNGLSVVLKQTKIRPEQLSILDVKDFATPVNQLELFDDAPDVRLLVETKANVDYVYEIQKNQLRVTIVPMTKARTDEQQFLLANKGKLTSINFQDIPVRSVLQLLAGYNDFNLVVSDTVQGNLTLRLDGVQWTEVLDIILRVKGLDKRVNGNVVLVAPKAELDLQEKLALEKGRLEEEIGTLNSEIIRINYAKASEIAVMIGGEGEVSMLSERGSIAIDERTNSLLIRELPSNITVIREIIASLDVPVKQVQIEARIVTINEGNMDELGIRWGITKVNGDTTIGGSIENNLATIGLYDSGDDFVDDFLNVNLGATSDSAARLAFQVASLGSNVLLDLELSALQQESKAEIISSPRLITTNKKSAYIEQGTEIPYLKAASSGATAVEFKKAVLSLTVTPQITPDNRLILDLNVTQDRPSQVVKTGEGEAVAIDTQRIGTQVLVNNGETVVLGGIFQHSITNSVDKVPLLGDIPGLGALFRRTYEKVGKSELLIFVTPEIIVQ
ncbi:fimbrial protein [Vibrio sp. 10N.286.49.C2]|uniref:type IV pilus secretin PilQ n=1 Tax=unclassified Vibrio TaxID=2614977 RepID=UPI000C8640CF|nr:MULTISPECIES: type IV pilus secretin PilQ family protein [unclassified Vibrio]PMH37903.1 fimbrial protein [Vibrio sp. 10N.286.49.C2]PMH53165.1 fimbrial protein [Vibrio sp. 10N.286.49.B1]PMH84035.1 fimbrial protein [Vibrio sp. 10N.286.48.B7]